ncbi:hypothetical protein H4Q26_007255 [Puccinia striiformis f. sp. tritici PST-130]|nr:hypothetical protein H4Q26_007255 [Puccinia striiformis f. sp. tritici PST-130]
MDFFSQKTEPRVIVNGAAMYRERFNRENEYIMRLNSYSFFVLLRFLTVVQPTRSALRLPTIPEELACEEGSTLHQIVNSVLDDVDGKIVPPETLAVSDSSKSRIYTSARSTKDISRLFSSRTMPHHDVSSDLAKGVFNQPPTEEIGERQIPQEYSKLIDDGADLIKDTFTRVVMYSIKNPQSRNAGKDLESKDLPFPPDTITKIGNISSKMREIKRSQEEIRRQAIKAATSKKWGVTRKSTAPISSSTISIVNLNLEFEKYLPQLREIHDQFAKKVHNLIVKQQMDRLNDLSEQVARYTTRPQSRASRK